MKKHHAASPGVWLVFPKKHTKLPTVSYAEAVEEALCFGWIDGLLNPIDDTHYKQLFTPRQAKSRWAASNKQRVEKLIAQGLMTEAGMKLIEIAKQTGTWTALDATEALELPPELKKAFRAAPGAKKAYDALTPSRRKQCLYYLSDAKKPETRARRVAQIIHALVTGAPVRG